MDAEDARTFLERRFGAGEVADVERLGGGAWSDSFGFRTRGRSLVARFGRWREDFEADRQAMAWAGPDLPVPRVLEIGDAPVGAYAISERHAGRFLEDLPAHDLRRLLPALLRALDALRAVQGPAGGDRTPWHEQLEAGLVDVPGERVSGWRARLAADAALDRRFVECEQRFRELLPRCPDRRDLLHRDLLHGNVLVTGDASRLEAVFDWGCTGFGDFAYELAWFSFWSPFHGGLAEVDVVAAAHEHLRSGAASAEDLAGLDERLVAYELHIGLTHLAYHGFTGEHDWLDAVATRMDRIG